MNKKHHLKEKLQESKNPNADQCEAQEEHASDTLEQPAIAEIEKLTAERDEWKNKAHLLAADMENLRKRVTIDMEKNAKYANTSFAKDLLPVADGLDKALEHAHKELDHAGENPFLTNMIAGIELVKKQLSDGLKKHNIEKMNSLGQIFDPNFHQVISQIDDPSQPAGTIVEEMQTGYMIGDRVLREAMVIVTK